MFTVELEMDLASFKVLSAHRTLACLVDALAERSQLFGGHFYALFDVLLLLEDLVQLVDCDGLGAVFYGQLVRFVGTFLIGLEVLCRAACHLTEVVAAGGTEDVVAAGLEGGDELFLAEMAPKLGHFIPFHLYIIPIVM